MRIRLQFFLYSVLQSLLIFQYDPIMTAGRIGAATRLSLLAVVQLLVAASLILCSVVMARRFAPQRVVQVGLITRVVATGALLVVPVPAWFVTAFLVYQLVALGLDTYYESTVMSWATASHRAFGRYRLFGSLGYATSGLYVTGLLVVTGQPKSILWLILGVNLALLALSQGESPLWAAPTAQARQQAGRQDWREWAVLILGTLIITLPNSFGYLLTAYLRQTFTVSLLTATALGSVALLLGSCVSEVIGFYSVEGTIHRFNAPRVILFGVALAGVRWIVAGAATTPSVFLLTYLAHGVSFSFIYVGTVNWLAARTGQISGQLATRFVLVANLVAIALARVYPSVLAHLPIRALLWGYAGLCGVTLVLLVPLLAPRKELAHETHEL